MSSTPTGTSTRNSGRHWTRVAAFLVLSALLPMAFALPSRETPIPLCGLKLFLHVSCPGCGMTRAVTALSQGNVIASLKLHAFALIFGGLAFAGWVGFGVGLVTGRDFASVLTAPAAPRVIMGILAAFLLYWLVRIATGTAP